MEKKIYVVLVISRGIFNVTTRIKLLFEISVFFLSRIDEVDGI